MGSFDYGAKAQGYSFVIFPHSHIPASAAPVRLTAVTVPAGYFTARFIGGGRIRCTNSGANMWKGGTPFSNPCRVGFGFCERGFRIYMHSLTARRQPRRVLLGTDRKAAEVCRKGSSISLSGAGKDGASVRNPARCVQRRKQGFIRGQRHCRERSRRMSSRWAVSLQSSGIRGLRRVGYMRCRMKLGGILRVGMESYDRSLTMT